MGLQKKLWLGISARIRVVLMAMLAAVAMKLAGYLAASGDDGLPDPANGARIALDQGGLSSSADMTAGTP